MSDLLRLYAPEECNPRTGYPKLWREINAEVCEQAGHRCLRCGHPYQKGTHGNGEWSRCDEDCNHAGPFRVLAVGTEAGYTYSNPGPPASYLFREELVEAQWRILTVHHLDGNKRNCRWWNLAALCQRDHLVIQGRVKMEQVWPHPHTAWFRPFAAGYYAWSYLGLDLSREETEARLDELLALELVAP